MHANYEECLAAGLVPKEGEKIAKGFSRYGKMARELGITVWGNVRRVNEGSVYFRHGG